MCGILGSIGHPPIASANLFQSALNSIAHRGPDAQGIWNDNVAYLGHRRLAIVDLSDAGTQPFVDKQSGMVIVFNGEIYNYLELRQQLIEKGHTFSTQTDTEVLLRGYLEWGEQVLSKCNGMWAFAIWNPKNHQIFLARDRFGVKPLYYAHQSQNLVFASEPKALHILDKKLLEISLNAIMDFIVNSQMHTGERTFYKSIKAVPPAHYAVFDTKSEQFSLHRYWDYPTPKNHPNSIEEQSDIFDELFVDAVRLRFRSDVPVGLTLSGGLDSSAILAATNKFPHDPINCYTSVFSKTLRGEEQWAKKAANYVDAQVDMVEAGFDDWMKTLKSIVDHMDGPGYSPAVFPLWKIMAHSRQNNIPVLLEGQGADELFAGYSQYPAIETLAHLKAGQLKSFLQGYVKMVQSASFFWATGWLVRAAFPTLVQRLTRDIRIKLFHPEIVENWRHQKVDPTLSTIGNTYNPVQKTLWNDHRQNVLPALLHYGDSVSMAHGIESRLPFLDYRLVEWVFEQSPHLLKGAETKMPVRSFLLSNKFDAIANRKDKQGYPTPVHQWYKKVGIKHLEDLIADKSAPIWKLMRAKNVKKLARSAQNGSKLGMFHLYKIITTDLWLRNLEERSN